MCAESGVCISVGVSRCVCLHLPILTFTYGSSYLHPRRGPQPTEAFFRKISKRSTNRIFRRILQSEILSHPTRKTHCMMNEISRKIPGICKKCEERSGRRGSKSDTAQVRWEMVAETQGQYRCQAVCSCICHTMYSVTDDGEARFTSRPEARGSGVEAVFRFLGSGVDSRGKKGRKGSEGRDWVGGSPPM